MAADLFPTEACDGQSKTMILARQSWQIDGKCLDRLSAVPVHWDAISPESQGKHFRGSTFPFAHVQMLQCVGVHALCVQQHISGSQPVENLCIFMWQQKCTSLQLLLMCGFAHNSNVSKIQTGPLVSSQKTSLDSFCNIVTQRLLHAREVCNSIICNVIDNLLDPLG